MRKFLIEALGISQVLLLASCGPPTSSGRDDLNDLNLAIAELDTAAGNIAAASNSAVNLSMATPTAPQTQWEYRTERDEARNAEIRFATVTSSNVVNFASPYDGGSSARMTIRRHPEHGLDITFSVQPSQMVCDVSNGCRALINIDGHQERITLLMPADYSSETLFVSGAQSLLSRIRGSRRVIIELPFYQEGNRQFTFDTSGLEWGGSQRIRR